MVGRQSRSQGGESTRKCRKKRRIRQQKRRRAVRGSREEIDRITNWQHTPHHKPKKPHSSGMNSGKGSTLTSASYAEAPGLTPIPGTGKQKGVSIVDLNPHSRPWSGRGADRRGKRAEKMRGGETGRGGLKRGGDLEFDGGTSR